LKELNSYLVRDKERSLLIDTGFRTPPCKEALLNGLEELGQDPGSVDVFLTHLHADHSGLAPDIIGAGRRIIVSGADGALLGNLQESVGQWIWNNTRNALIGIPPDVAKIMEKVNPAIKFAPPRGVRYACVNDGDTLRAGGYSLRCILTPGHTPGHMCLWDEDSGVMFTGDHVLFDITPNITAWPDVGDSLGDYLDSLRAIREYPVKAALPGHRSAGDFHARIDELCSHHMKRIKEVEGIVRAGSGLTVYEIAGKMHWEVRSASWDDFPVSQKIFAVGECLSHLDYLRIRGAISRDHDKSVYLYH